MKRLLAIACICAVALGAPGALAGGGKKYEGSFSGSGILSFKVEKRQDGKKIVNFKFRDLLVTCGATPKLTSGGLSFGVPVDKNRFSTKAVSGDPSNPRSSRTLKGELNRRKADGTLRVFGSKVNVGGDPPERDECDSGTVDWDASR